MLAIVSCIDWEAPWPISRMAMTAATPMMTPSVVRIVRMGLRVRALRAMPIVRKMYRMD